MRAWRAFRSHRGSYQYSQQLLRPALCWGIAATDLYIFTLTLLRPFPAWPTPNSSRPFHSCRILPDVAKLPSLSYPKFEPDNPTTWLQLVEPLLPVELRESSPSSLSTTVEHISPSSSHPTHAVAPALSKIVSRAHKEVGIDLLAHLALREGRWEATLWISKLLAEHSKVQHMPWASPYGFSTIAWPLAISLDQISCCPFLFDNEAGHGFSHGPSLQNFSAPDARNDREESAKEDKHYLGQLWQSLANLTIEAANRSDGESREIMVEVVHVLAYLRQRHLIPETILDLCPAADSDTLKRSGLFGKWATHMYESLRFIENSGDEYSEHIAHDSRMASTTSSASYPKINLRPHLWLEFILWCCVQGQFLMEASTIVNGITKTWSLFSWREASQPSSDREPDFTSPLPLKQASKTFPNVKVPDLVLQRSLSVEVLAAIIDGLVATMSEGTEQNAKIILNRINGLKSLLHQNETRLGNTTWDVLISRIIRSPAVVTVETSPSLTESALILAEDQVRGSQSSNSSLDGAPFAFDSMPAFVSDGCAAVVGLYYRTLVSYIDWHDKSGALRLLTGFLSWGTPRNKYQSGHDVFARRETNPAEQNTMNSHYSKVPYSFLVPKFPAEVLAKLLDFTVDTRNMDLGKDMLYPRGNYRPLIPEELYREPAIFSSLIRFAQETNDSKLLSQLTKAKDGTVTTEALVALCDHRLRKADFKSAMEVLIVINSNLKRRLSIESVTILIKALLPHICGNQVVEEKFDERRQSKNTVEHTSDEPADFLQLLLRGDFMLSDETSRAQLRTVIQILASLDPQLGELCSQFQPHQDDHTAKPSNFTFDRMMEVAVFIWGSEKGKELYNNWCRRRKHHMRLSHLSVAEQFSMPRSNQPVQSDVNSIKVKPKDAVDPKIATVRIIVQAAVNELRAQAPDKRKDAPTMQDSRAQAVLRWASRILENEFSLSRADVNYELGGVIMNRPPRWPKEPLYKHNTLRAWIALRSKRSAWANVMENKLRLFAISVSQRVLVFDQLGPTERFFLRCLCADYGLYSKLFRDKWERDTPDLMGLKVWKIGKSGKEPRIPRQTVDEYMETLYQTEDPDWEPEEDPLIIDMESQRARAQASEGWIL